MRPAWSTRRLPVQIRTPKQWSVDDAEGHEQDAEQARRHVLRDDLVLTKGTKQDLVEGGRRGDGSVHVDPVLRFQAIEFTRSAAALGGQNIRHIQGLKRGYRPLELTLDEHAPLENRKLAACNTLASQQSLQFKLICRQNWSRQLID